jgi:glycosyltransferase involved in cell wall biosynthesis
VFSPREHHQTNVEYLDGVQYRHISKSLVDTLIGLTVFRINAKIPRLEYALRKRPFFASTLHQFSYILRVAKELQAMKCDIVHIHEESQFIPIIRLLNPKIRIVLHMHCVWLTQFDHEMIEQRIKKADLILGCSNYITEQIRKEFPSLAERCHTLYNGVDLSVYSYNPKNKHNKNELKRLLTVGRVTPEKGLHVLLEALREVVEKNPQVHLDIIGPLDAFTLGNIIWLSEDENVKKLEIFHKNGSLKAYYIYLTQKIISLNISNKVAFRGQIPHRETVKFYQAADIFIQPSIIPEPFGMPIIEAMACRVPVIASRVGGIPEIIENERSGILVEARDSHSLAYAILELLSDEDLRIKMGELGRTRSESFSWDKISANLLQLYEGMFESM